ncbi:putative cytochrome, mitochondrial [Armadillidium vulgare]|nr:putative cytochrome, mitochondrial [Armadillidium vulgare]
MPGLNTSSALKEFLKAKILNHNGLNVFDSRETLTLWKNMRNVYGPTFKMNIVGRPNVVVVTCPDDIENLYRMTEKNPIRLGLSSLKKARMMGTSDFGRGGIIVEQNDEWRRIRSKAQTPMLKPKKILRYLKVMDNVSRDFTDSTDVKGWVYKSLHQYNNFIQQVTIHKGYGFNR